MTRHIHIHFHDAGFDESKVKRDEGGQFTATSKRIRANQFAEIDVPEQAHTHVKLSNGKEHRIGKLNSTESMGLPGWHDLQSTENHTYLGETEQEAIAALIKRAHGKS